MAKTRLDEVLENAVERGVDTKNRIVYLVGDVETETSRRLQIGLKLLDSTEGDITVVVDTLGGYCFEGFAIYEAIKACKNRVTTHGTGAIMSMGAAVLQGGDHRVLTRHSVFMVHNGSTYWEGETDRIPGWVTLAKLERDSYHEILAERSKLPIAKVRALCRKEAFLSAKEALALGFCDEVVG